MSAPILEVLNIEVVYNSVALVLKGVSLSLREGGIVALLGANGAGKTTTLRAISNLLSAERGEVTKGEIKFLGERVEALFAQRAGAPRRDPGDGRPPLFRPPHCRRKSAYRRFYASRRAHGDPSRP